MWRWVVPVAMASVVFLSGCATSHTGIIKTLPRPVDPARFRVPRRSVERPVVVPAPVPLTATRFGEPGWRPRSGIRNRWQSIVIHHSASRAGDARTFDKYHRNVKRWDELGYHFVIGNGTGSGDGQVEVGSRWLKQKHGAHCKTPDNFYNDHGVGICLVGDFRAAAPSRAQMASLQRLVRFLTRECGISPSNVVAHGAVTGKTVCPGARFPLFALRRSVSAPVGGGGMTRNARSTALAAP